MEEGGWVYGGGLNETKIESCRAIVYKRERDVNIKIIRHYKFCKLSSCSG